jgi:hypothetical protein
LPPRGDAGKAEPVLAAARGTLDERAGPIKEGARKVVCDDWHYQRGWEQQRWAYLFGTGLISEAEAIGWREDVWPSEPVEEEDDDVA